MNAEAARPSRVSEKRYQSVVWVSAIATTIRNRNAENSRTSPRDSDRSPRLMGQGRILQEGRAGTARALFRQPRQPSPRRLVREPHARGPPARSPWPELLRPALLPLAAPVAK